LAAPGGGPRLALWAAVVLAYGAFWFAFALTVNAIGRGSATNAVSLLAAWLTAVVLVPSLYSALVTARHPSPSRVELTVALRRASNAATERASVLLQKYYQDHPELMPTSGAVDMDDLASRAIAVTQETERSLAPTLAAFDQRLIDQQALADRYRFVSPAIIVHAALADIAGTSLHRYRHYQAQVDRFQDDWRRLFTPQVFGKRRLEPADYDAFPTFQYEEESIGDVVRRVVPGVLGLVVLAILAGSFAVQPLGRVSVVER
jgi:ABC-2 type transport system permease protein